MDNQEEILRQERLANIEQDYYESLEEPYEVEIERCKGDMCMNYAEDDDTHLCKECKGIIQRCFNIWKNQFNKEEQEYLIYWLKEREV